jgi:seryl-tRNA synthetase
LILITKEAMTRMLDAKRIRNNPDEVKQAMESRGKGFAIEMIDKIIGLDEKRRQMLVELEAMKGRRNIDSQEIPKLRKSGQNTDALMSEMKALSDRIKQMDEQLNEVDKEIEYYLLRIPNIPHSSVPAGTGDMDNREIRRWGEPREFEYEPKTHWEIGTDLGILDFETAGKVTGARFTFYLGLGSRLERACINFMLDLHTEKHGYKEVFPPFIVNRGSMQGTGQLPKFEDEAFKVADTDYFLIPTAEVPVTNMFRDDILDVDKLPVKYTAYSACFRSEAGSAGRDTRGLIRQHQFNKVELVKLVEPDRSYDELESLTVDAEDVLKMLGLPYRVVTLCTGDLGFSSAKTYDIEVWMPSYGRYVEISSCSNFEDFQARRANIKYRQEPKGKPKFLHTLNGSGVAAGRTVAAILENYQQSDGSVIIPEVLKPYMGRRDIITK